MTKPPGAAIPEDMLIQTNPADHPLLKSLSVSESVAMQIADAAGKLAVNLVSSVLILTIAVWASGWLSGLVRRALGRIHGHHAPDPTLIGFIASLVRYLILVVGIVAVLQQLGVQATSVVAVLGAASLAIGLAMQGALSNVAAGVMILLFRPYRVGDVIEVGTRQGRVRNLDLFTTELATADNLKIVVPNSKVFGDVIVNHSFHSLRRIDAVFRVPPAISMQAVVLALEARAKADPRVLDDPAPVVEVTSVTEAYAEGSVKAWVKRDDLPGAKADMLLAARLLAVDPKAQLPPFSAPAATAAPINPKAGIKPPKTPGRGRK